MQPAQERMSRRYVYRPRMTARQLSDAMHRLDMTAGQLARLTGVGIDRIQRMLKGDDGFDVPVHVQSSFYVWEREPQALKLAHDFASEYAYDKRDENNQ